MDDELGTKEKSTTKSTNTVSDTATEATTEVVSEIETLSETEKVTETATETEITAAPVKKANLSEAEELIVTSKELVAKVESDVKGCKADISEAADAFDDAKRTFKNTTFQNCETLLEKAGFEYTTFEEGGKFELAVDADQESFSINNLSSGKFTGFILAIIAALLTVVAWVYLAMTKLGVNPASVNLENANEQVNPVLNWIGGEMIAANGNVIVGVLVLGFSALVVGWIVYAIRVSLKSSKNLRVAKDTFNKSNEYCTTQEESQKEMKKVDEHLREATREIENFETILNEKSAILNRIIHVEGAYDEERDYHPSSKKEMRETEKIMRASEHLLATSITEDKKLNFEAVQALNTARGIYSEYLNRIYD